MTDLLTLSAIIDIDFERRTNGILVDLTVTDQDDETTNQLHLIRREDLEPWLRSSGYLEWVIDKSDTITGEHVQEQGETGYIDFINTWLDGVMLHEYLKAKGLTTLKYMPE